MLEFDLPLIWAAIIAFAILAYVSLDGFDLGVGILFPLVAEKAGHRDVMMNSVAPIWDGNETWLVLGGGGLLAVFPLAYAVVLPALSRLLSCCWVSYSGGSLSNFAGARPRRTVSGGIDPSPLGPLWPPWRKGYASVR